MGKTSLPPGFRFHPTDTELIKYYLKRKVMGKKICFESIAEVDIYKHAPSDLPDMSFLRTGDLKWYFFCPVEKKYGRGARFNRATESGYWKTTGKDRPVLYNQGVAGMIRTLVFHTGKAPKGERTDWVMHEYRLEDKELADKGIAQDAYVLCVIFKKDGPGPRNGAQYGAPFREEDWSDDECNCDCDVSPAGLSTPAYVDPIYQVGSVATTSCVPENFLSTPASVDPVDPVGSVVTSSSAPENFLSTPASVEPINQVGSGATASCVPENLCLEFPSVYEVSPVASTANNAPMSMEAPQILSDNTEAYLANFLEDIPWEPMFHDPLNHAEANSSPVPSVEALLANFSEDIPWEPMVHGPLNHAEASSSPVLSMPVNHVKSVASSSYVAENPVSSADILHASASNVPSMVPGANNGSGLMRAPSPEVPVADDDLESLLAGFTVDGTGHSGWHFL